MAMSPMAMRTVLALIARHFGQRWCSADRLSPF
jgi:hypothetical protein